MNPALTDQQRDAAYTLGADICVDAGAGSGKTTVLVERVMHLLDRGVELRRIVAITFTRKAAGEMKERLREAIHRRPENDPKSMDKWRALELEVETARITTIDGFCAALLHENALRAGLDPDFATLGDEEAPLLRREVAEATLTALLDGGDATAHRLVVEHGLERTTGFIADALNQVAPFEDAARPYAGLDAAGLAALWRMQAEDLQRLRYEELGRSPDLARLLSGLREFDGQCSDAENKAELLRRNAILFLGMAQEAGNREAQRTGINGLASLKLQGGSKKGWRREEVLTAVKALVKEARTLAEQYEEPELHPEVEEAAAQRTLDLIAVFAAAAQAYRAAKRARTALDFGDLLTSTVELLHAQSDLRARVASGIAHLLMDEFQDTNHSQLALAQMLAGEGGAELFIVGDAKQSVYRFRGAEVGVFAEARHAVRMSLPLNENFRSVKPLIAFINDFFERSVLLARVEPEFHRLSARRDAEPGAVVEFLRPEVAAEEENAAEDNEAVLPRESEAELIAGRIAELCGPGGVRVFDKESKAWRPARFGDVAILYRAATHAGIYEEALRHRGVPANVIAGSGFYARQEILDLHNLFSTALDPWNEPALAALLRSPLAGVSDDTLFRLTRERKLADAFWSGAAAGEARDDCILCRARELLAFIRARREWPVAALMRELLARTGFEAVLLAQRHGVQRAHNVHKLIELARDFGGAGRQGLHTFTQYLSSLARNGLRAGDAELLAAGEGAVTLMTVHNAKGLEFPIVVVADMGRAAGAGRTTPICIVDPRRGLAGCVHGERGETAWPVLGQHLKRHDREDDRAEEARVLYVAMTRARDRLLLSSATKISDTSWMAALDAQFNLEDRVHGEPVGGAAWEALMIRRTGETPVPTPVRRVAAPDVEALLKQVAPVHVTTESGDAIPVRTLLDLLHPEPAAAAPHAAQAGTDRRLRGSAAHAMLERWDFAQDAPALAAARDFFPAQSDRERCARELNDIAERFRRSALWKHIARAKDLRRELPFVHEIAGVLLHGVIDALVDSRTIVDYKLALPQPCRLARYQTQLQLYAAAIRAATNRAPDEALLYYLDSGEFSSVDVSPAALERVLARAATALHRLRSLPQAAGV